MHTFENAYLEITNCCNRKCAFCPGTPRVPGFLSPAEFRRRLSEVLPLAKTVYLHVLGEPLLHPDFPELLAIAAELGADLKITTNGDLAGSAAGEALLHCDAVRQINFSVHALEAGSEWEALARLIGFARRSLELKPERYLNFRLWNSGGGSGFNDEVMRRVGAAFGVTCTQPENRRSSRVSGRLYFNFDKRFDWPKTGELPQPGGRCHGMESQFAILWGGEVTLCCLDGDGAAMLGNCREGALAGILNGAEAQAIRMGWKRGCAVAELCKGCRYRARFEKAKKIPPQA